MAGGLLNSVLDTFDGIGLRMDLSTILILGWIVFCFVVLVILAVIRTYYLKPRGTAEQIKQQAATTEPTTTNLNGASADTATTATTAKPSPAAGGGRSPRVSGGGGRGVASTGSPLKPTSLKPKEYTRSPHFTPPIGIDKDGLLWVDNVLNWVYQDTSVISNLTDLWIATLNDLTKAASVEHGVNVVFELLQPSSQPIKLSNITVEVNPQDEFTSFADVTADKLEFLVRASRQKGDRIWSSSYILSCDQFSGKLRIFGLPMDKYITIRFAETPPIGVTIKPASESQSATLSLDEQAIQQVVEEITCNALSSWQLDLDFSQHPDCPQFSRPQLEPLAMKPIHYDSMMTAVPAPKQMFIPPPQPVPPSKKDKRLLVKVIKAHNLGVGKGCSEPYCVVEIDEPPQKHQTSFAADTNSPFWDEHFLFDLNSNSSELLFELIDRSKNYEDGFLGLGILSVDELLKMPSQRQVITLQPRPYEKDEVSGTVTIEFLFMESADIPILPESSSARQSSPYPAKRTETNRTVTPTGTVITTTTTLISKPFTGTVDEQNSTSSDVVGTDPVPNGGDDIASTALRELESKSPGNTTTNKSTLIIHSVQREVVQPTVKVERSKNGKWHEVTQPGEGNYSSRDSNPSLERSSPIDHSGSHGNLSDRSRPKERKSFMNTIRKRFSFRSRRSKSMDQPGNLDIGDDSGMSRSASAERAQSNPEVPGATIRPVDTSSTRSSLSETSGISSSSTQTYLNDASTLVIETIENGITKYYLLPISMANKSRWRKKGTKLHIYNDHTFVAKHLPGNIVCQVCTRAVPRRIGKQGYECRDCHLRCHKHCHVKIDIPCANSTVNLMELEYVEDPRANSLRSGRRPKSN